VEVVTSLKPELHINIAYGVIVFRISFTYGVK